jgi:hypothetical protein
VPGFEPTEEQIASFIQITGAVQSVARGAFPVPWINSDGPDLASNWLSSACWLACWLSSPSAAPCVLASTWHS